MGFVGIRDGAIKRAELVDAELGWVRGTAIGKMALIWDHTLELELPRVKRKALLRWAGTLPEGTSDDDFIDALTDPDVRFLIPGEGDRFEVKGAQKELAKIGDFKEKKRAAGRKSGEARRDNRTPAQHVFEQNANENEPKPSQAKPSLNQASNNPLYPPLLGGKKISKRDLKSQAEAEAAEVLRELSAGHDEMQARLNLKTGTMEVVLKLKPSWRKFCAEASRSLDKGDWEPFCYRFRDAFVAMALTKRSHDGPSQKLADDAPVAQ